MGGSRLLQMLWHLFAHIRILHLPVGNVDVRRVLVVQQAAHVAHGRVYEALLLVQAALLDRFRQRARVRKLLQRSDRKVPRAGDVHALAEAQVAASQEAEERDGAVAFGILADGLFWREVLQGARSVV